MVAKERRGKGVGTVEGAEQRNREPRATLFHFLSGPIFCLLFRSRALQCQPMYSSVWPDVSHSFRLKFRVGVRTCREFTVQNHAVVCVCVCACIYSTK